MANLLSNTANLFMTGVFFAPLIPITIPICFLGMFFAYFVEKVSLISYYI